MSRKFLLIVCIIIGVIFTTLFLLYSKVIFQEGNPWPEIKGIVKISLSNQKVVKILESSEEGTWYMAKSSTGREDFIKFMESNGFTLYDQMGAGYLFKTADQKTRTVIYRHYTRFYGIWKVEIK